jgi:hypothetical protein
MVAGISFETSVYFYHTAARYVNLYSHCLDKLSCRPINVIAKLPVTQKHLVLSSVIFMSAFRCPARDLRVKVCVAVNLPTVCVGASLCGLISSCESVGAERIGSGGQVNRNENEPY